MERLSYTGGGPPSSWSYFPTSPLRSLSAEQPLLLPAVQHDFGSSHVDSTEIRRRQDAVRSVFLKCWRSYKSRAWLHDELKPVTGGARDTFGGWAATLVDALDTLWIMDLCDDFYEAAAAAVSLDFANSTTAGVNLFETTLRHLGGLLSAYDLSGEEALLRKATELGEMLYHAFDTPNRMPPFWFDFEAAKAGQLLADTSVGSAAPASLALEFTRLSQLTGDAKFFDAISGMTDFLETTQNTSLLPGMWPKRLNLRDKTLPDNLFTLGGQADSLYEYLPKMHALLGGSEPRYAALYGTAMGTALKHLAFRPMVPDAGNTSRSILFTGDVSLENGTNALIPSYQHLSCFVGGMFGLAGKLLQLPYHVSIGEQITEGCVWAYNGTPTGIMPEVFSLIPCPEVDDSCQWNETRWQREGADERFAKGYASVKDSRYILRPEAIESVFVCYRITGDERWRDEAWIMFQSIMVATETEYGNSAIEDVVMEGQTKKKDEMESFWAETLKYFYLIFPPPDLFSLDEYVFNTEAHPLRRPKPTA
ncbi:Glycoside hydrolase [Rhypophila sp. PSN 637]